MTFVGTALNDKELNRSMMLDDNMTVLIEDKYKSNVISAIRGSKSYVYEKTIESSYVGYGHDGIFPEYTLDIPVKPDRCYVINDKQMLGHIKFVSEDYIKSVKKKYKNGRMVFNSTPFKVLIKCCIIKIIMIEYQKLEKPELMVNLVNYHLLILELLIHNGAYLQIICVLSIRLIIQLRLI